MRSRWLLLAGVLLIPACDDRKPASADPPPGRAGGPAGQDAGAADAPYVRGSIVVVGQWKEARLIAGFAGQGADGKPRSNGAGTTFSPDSGAWVASETFRPQITSIDSRDRPNPEYRHTHLPPGDYIVYVHLGGVPAAWKKVTVKPGDQQTVDLTIDPARTGGLKVSLPDADADDPVRRPLLLIPADIDLPGTAWHPAFEAAEVKPGTKVVSVTGVPAGKYRAVRGKSAGPAEVTEGKVSEFTLVRDEPKTK